MSRALLVLALALPAAAGDLGGHALPTGAEERATPADARQATLEEMWQRRLLPPDQSEWAPQDLELLGRIRRVEKAAIAYLRRRRGGERPWVARARSAGPFAPEKLTKEGYERYLFLLSQDALQFFEDRGAGAKWALKLRDWDDKPLFDGMGRITDEGVRVYDRARLNLEVFWKSPDGEVFGTRRPPAKTPAFSNP
ncbi:MAG: hypothetical protein KGL74_11290 [Elusimicrobia bacterium]|nr:hypothetical protein [Elusimicrobiota bacterium]